MLINIYYVFGGTNFIRLEILLLFVSFTVSSYTPFSLQSWNTMTCGSTEKGLALDSMVLNVFYIVKEYYSAY